jgi:hypothetical protein
LKSPLVLASDRLRISFQRDSSDRFGHTIELVDGGRAYALLTSIEGTAEEPWPVSPPFQEAHLEQRPGGRQVVLLVGMAGHSHWSGSVEIDPQTDSAAFDIACRLRGRADWLGSRYAIAGDVLTSQPGQIRLAVSPSTGLAAPEQLLLLEVPAAEDSAVLTQVGGELQLAAQAAESASAHTARWRYAVAATASRP